MKTFAQKLAILAVAVMLVSLVLAGTCQAATSTFKNVSIGNVAGKEGQEVSVEVKATEDLKIEEGGLLVKFDSKKLKFKSVKATTVPDTMIMADNRTNSSEGGDGVVIAITATGADASTIKKGTVIATITFEILKGATGTQTLTLVDDQDEAQTPIATGKVTATVATPASSKPTSSTPASSKPVSSTQPSSTQSKPASSTTSKPATSNKNDKDKTPGTGVVDFVVIGSMITLVAAVGLAVISKRK